MSLFGKKPPEGQATEKPVKGGWKGRLKGWKRTFQTRAFRAGGYSVAATAILLAIAVAVNVFAGALPDSLTQVDITSNQLYSLSDQSKQLLSQLDQEVTIYWIVQSGQEDGYLEHLLDRYDARSDQLTVEKRDPDVYPTFAQQYTDETVYNNSLVVVCGEKSHYVDANDLYEYDYTNYYTTGSVDTSFAGESQITSAITYVTSEEQPKIYTLTGHGEGSLAADYQSALESQNMETEELSLISQGEIPEDAGAILIIAPQSDLAAEEVEMLQSYLQAGGSLFLLTDLPQEGSLTNLDALMSGYGVSAAQGVVAEGDSQHYGLQNPFYLLPDLGSHEITSPLTDGNYLILLAAAQGLQVSDQLPEDVTVTSLLTTSDQAYSKVAGYELTTYEKEEGDIDGPFDLAVAITQPVTADSGEDTEGSESAAEDAETRIVWVSSSTLLDEECNARVSGANQDLFLNALAWMCGQEESVSIHAKSMSYQYLTMDSGTSSMLGTALMVIPVIYLGIGVAVWFRRRRK